MAPSGELRGKGRCGEYNLQVKLCDPHLSALDVRFSRRGAIQIYVYLYTFLPLEMRYIGDSTLELDQQPPSSLATLAPDQDSSAFQAAWLVIKSVTSLTVTA